MGISVKSGMYSDWTMTRMGISVNVKSGLCRKLDIQK